MLNKAERIAFANPKGGSGKITSSLRMFGYLVKRTHKVFASIKVVVPLEPSGFFLKALKSLASLQKSVCENLPEDKRR